MHLLSTNITSPLGLTTEQNYLAVKAGRTALAHHQCCRGVPFPFEAALFTEQQWEEIRTEGFTPFESLVLHSVRDALSRATIDVASPRTILILSTTKGDIGIPPGETATRIAHAVGVRTTPIVVCNACISGVAAQVLALRMTEAGYCDTAIVTGADVQGGFIISGFQSLKALSEEPCRPFDAERLGLNLGEAAATMIYRRGEGGEDAWHLTAGAVRNDAYHISGPHPKGEGCLRALQQVAAPVEQLAVIGVHGTATMYNDQMESKAIERAGLSAVPLSALKGYYGHTMGAAGLLETIITARALDDGGTILPSLGYHERGVSGKVLISGEALRTDKRDFIKMLSGFGGCNGAIRLSKQPHTQGQPPCRGRQPVTKALATVKLSAISADSLSEMYKRDIGDYPKFHKMDHLSRLAFVATEKLLKDHPALPCDDTMAVILFNRTSSVVADNAYAATISDPGNYYPSPALFVHTLPNISTGEVALRHGLHGETSFFILPAADEHLMQRILRAAMLDTGTHHAIAGWIDCPGTAAMDCELTLYEAVTQCCQG